MCYIREYSLYLDPTTKHTVLKEIRVFERPEKSIKETREAVELMNDVFDLQQKADEHMYLIAMDCSRNILGIFLLSVGTNNQTLSDMRGIFVRLCLCGAARFIAVHNHPSGSLYFSDEDMTTAKRMFKCSVLMNINLDDFIVVTQHGLHVSLLENGVINKWRKGIENENGCD